MSRGALEAMLSVTGQQEFAATMDMAMGKVRELAATTDLVTKNMATMNTRLDAAFSTQRISQMRGMNGELGTMKGHLRSIVSMLGGPGVIAGFGLFEAVKSGVTNATNQMQWVTEGGANPNMVPGLARLSRSVANQGISTNDAGVIIRQVESAYNGSVTASDPRLTGILKNSSIINAISGGKVSVTDAASILIPALQVDPSLKNDPTRAGRVLLAMIGSGNMQTSDALSILQTPALGTAAGQGISLESLAPFYAFGADTRGGPQAQQFARTLATSFINLSKGGATLKGRKDLAALLGDGGDLNKSRIDMNNILQQPDGAAKAVNLIYSKLSGMKGGLNANGELSGQSLGAIYEIFGGTRGGQGPLAVYGNPKLWAQKQADVARRLDPMYYDQATGLALSNPQHQLAVAKATFQTSLTSLGDAALPLLNKALPALTEMFKVMGDPNVIRFAELMIGLRAASLLGGGLGALSAGGGVVTGGRALLTHRSINPFTAYTAAKAAKAAGKSALRRVATNPGVDVGAGEIAAEAGGGLVATVGGVPLALGALTVGGVFSDWGTTNPDIIRQNNGLSDASWFNQNNTYKSQVPSGMGHTFVTFQKGSIVAADPQKAAEEMAKELAKAAARK